MPPRYFTIKFVNYTETKFVAIDLLLLILDRKRKKIHLWKYLAIKVGHHNIFFQLWVHFQTSNYFHSIFVPYHIMHSKPITFFKCFLIFSWWILKLPSCKQAQYAITIQVDIDTSHGLNSEFSFSQMGCYPRLKNLLCPDI